MIEPILMSQIAIPIKENVLLVHDLPPVEQVERARTNWNLSAFMKQWNKEHPTYWQLFKDDGSVLKVER